jgi:hypothetical protein
MAVFCLSQIINSGQSPLAAFAVSIAIALSYATQITATSYYRYLDERQSFLDRNLESLNGEEWEE